MARIIIEDSILIVELYGKGKINQAFEMVYNRKNMKRIQDY
jgi:hypothetical protein